jgi:hypothetical protein
MAREFLATIPISNYQEMKLQDNRQIKPWLELTTFKPPNWHPPKPLHQNPRPNLLNPT